MLPHPCIQATLRELFPLTDKGAVKMLYDGRRRPQAVFLNDQVFLVYNGDARTLTIP